MSRFAAGRFSEVHALRPVFAVEPLDDREQDLARSLAAEFGRLTVVAAGEGGRRLPSRSLAARLQTRFLGLNSRAQARIAEISGTIARRALGDAPAEGTAVGDAHVGVVRREVDRGGTLVAEPVTRRAASGSSGSSGRELRPLGGSGGAGGAGDGGYEADPYGVDETLGAGLRRLLRRRLDGARPDMERAVEDLLRGDRGRPEAVRVARTKVQLRLASNENLDRWRREIGFSSIEQLDFRWETEEPGANRGYWELRGPVVPGHEGDLIASGYLPDAMSGDDVGGYFHIPLRDYLPPMPPQESAVYHVRVLPLGRGRLARYTTTADRVLRPIDPGAARPAPEGVGPWSAPAVIRYGVDHATPAQEFDIEPRSVYRKARFTMDWMKLVQDQTGPGDEEYHIAGFVMRHTPQGVHVPVKIGPYQLTLDPDDRSEHPFGTQATFEMLSPKYTYWPQTFSVLISIMEEDDGGALNDWHAAIAEVADEMMRDAFTDEIESFMREMQERIEEMQEEIVAEMTAEMAALISAMIASTTREIISAVIAVVVAYVLAHIRAGAVDDFYGMRVYGMTLSTNDAALIENGSAGRIFTNWVPARGGDFEGTKQPDDSFRLEQTELQFLGMSGALEGSPVSGIVNVAVHWEFDDHVDI